MLQYALTLKICYMKKPDTKSHTLLDFSYIKCLRETIYIYIYIHIVQGWREMGVIANEHEVSF